jgi:hypothetical protein
MAKLNITYGDLELCAGLELSFHPEGTLVRRFNVALEMPDGKPSDAIGVIVYFHPDTTRNFLLLEDGIAERMMCYTTHAVTLFVAFCNWLSKNKEKVYPTKEDFLRRPETFPNYKEAGK